MSAMLPADWLARLPHRPPMRLVEEVLDVDAGRQARTRRAVRATDWYFDGHFPGVPVIPAIVLIELLAQTGGLAAGAGPADEVRSLRVAAVNDFKFPAGAGPGVTLEATARVAGRLGRLTKIEGTVTADGRIVATGSLMLADVGDPPGAP
jgi:3-hydroxyacyl-[acyl-carrier-protein] dehydratase